MSILGGPQAVDGDSDGAIEDIRPFDPDDTAAKMKATGYEYFLEIDVIKEDVLGIFSQWPKKPPTEDEKVRVILYYAENDAYPEWVFER